MITLYNPGFEVQNFSVTSDHDEFYFLAWIFFLTLTQHMVVSSRHYGV